MYTLKRYAIAGVFGAATFLMAVPTAMAQEGEGEGAGPAVDFCQDFRELLENDLLTGLDEEVATFLGLLLPSRADINGSFFIDDSSGELRFDVSGNGVPDAGNELGLLAALLNDPSFNSGPVTHGLATLAWENNLAQLQEDIGPDLFFLRNGNCRGYSPGT